MNKRVKQGNAGEKDFASWLNDNNCGFIEIKQNADDLANVFKGALKRPDFLILLPGIGLIAIDVKNHNISRDRFSLNIPKDLAKSVEFEAQFKVYLWYAFKDVQGDKETWFFISALDAIEHGEKKVNSGNGQSFVYVPLDKFTKVQSGEEMSKLLTARIGKIGTVARMVENYFSSAKIAK